MPSTIFITAASSVTSTLCPVNSDASLRADSFNASNSSCARNVTATLAPSCRNARLTERPRPPVPPATKTSLFETLPDIVIAPLIRLEEWQRWDCQRTNPKISVTPELLDLRKYQLS